MKRKLYNPSTFRAHPDLPLWAGWTFLRWQRTIDFNGWTTSVDSVDQSDDMDHLVTLTADRRGPNGQRMTLRIEISDRKDTEPIRVIGVDTKPQTTRGSRP